MEAMLGGRASYITFFLATAASATYGGFGPGLFSTVLGGLLANSLVIPVSGPFRSGTTREYLELALFVAVGGLISYLAGRLQDATLHQNALRILFQQTLTSVGDGIISTDEQQRVLLMNPVAENLTGWSQQEARGRPLADVFRIFREGSDEPAEIPFATILRTGQVAGLANHTELVHRDGRRIPVDDSAAPIRDEQGRIAGAVLVFRDVTARRQAERGLQGAERRSRAMLESITDAFFLLDHEWRYAEMNSAAERLLGGGLTGKNHWEQHPETLGTEAETLYRKAMRDGVPVRFEYHAGSSNRWFDVSAYPSPEGLAVYIREITEGKRTEQEMRRLNENLTHFTFAASHDLREPLRMVTLYAQQLQRRLGGRLDDEEKEFVQQIIAGAERMGRLVDGLLEFFRSTEIDESGASPVETGPALREALDNLRAAIQESQAEITHDDLPAVLATHTPLCQLLQNLVGNAIKYRKPRTRPVIHVRARREGSYQVIAVSDNGIGIAPEYQERIFEPFKRLHGQEIAGAGIGLATCKRIVEQLGGKLWLESREGEGSTFYFSLRAAGDGHIRSE